jgi:hypothetical protein
MMLTRDQYNVHEYLKSGSLFYEAFSTPEERPMRDVLLGLDGAIASFGRAEMMVRQVERDTFMPVRHSPWSMDETLSHYHRAGLNSLSDASESLREFRAFVAAQTEQQRGRDFDARRLDERLARFDRGVRVELGSLELKANDVERLIGQLDQALAVAREGDPLRLLDHIGGKLDELAKVRRGEDRGMVDNIPWWKIVAVAAFFAIAVWALIKCGWRWFGWSCSPNEALIYVLIAKAAALGYYLC